MNPNRLVADVGGTNIRLAISAGGASALEAVTKLECAKFASLGDALQCYLNDYAKPREVSEACLAVAGPTETDPVSMTNLPWTFSRAELAEQCGLDSVEIINDFAAVAAAIPALNATEVQQLGGGEAHTSAPRLAIGPGTGLGMASVLSIKGQSRAFPAEGGHACIAAQTQQEHEVVQYFREQGQAGELLNREFFLSGRGLCAIHEALGGEALTAEQISTAGSAGENPLCVQALSVFCAWLGSICGDQALSLGARGGVYIAGGMVKKFLPFFLASDFRTRFENKGKMRGYLQAIPCYIITRDHVALLGAAVTDLHQQ